MSNPATDEARNIQHFIDSINSAYTTAGLPPEITSGGGSGAIFIKKFYNII